MNGNGTYKWATGIIYTGEFKDNKINGQGKCIHKDGTTYEGEWKDGVQHGKGKLTNPQGKVKKGLWIAGKYQRKSSKIQSPDGKKAEQDSVTQNSTGNLGEI